MAIWKKSSEKSIFDYFEAHSLYVFQAAGILKECFDGEISGEEAAKKIKEYEHAADNITHELTRLIRTQFITPIDRRDIANFINTQDDVIDNVEKAISRFVDIYGLTDATAQAKNLAGYILKLSEFLVKMCPLLRNPSKYQKEILNICVEIHGLENLSDKAKRSGTKESFLACRSSRIEVLTFNAWHEIYGLLEAATDRAEDCANLAEQIVLEYS